MKFELSEIQRQIYIASKLDNTGVLYNTPLSYDITGDLCVNRLKSALLKVINTNTGLRSYFIEDVDGIFRKTVEKLDIELTCEKVTRDELENRLNQLAQPFDLSIAPLFRFKLLKISDSKHVLLSDIHHSIFDGSSVGTFMKELMAFYSDSSIEVLKKEYTDYVDSRNSFKLSDEFTRQQDFWTEKLSGETSKLELPFDKLPSDGPDYVGDEIVFHLDRNLISQIKSTAKQVDATVHSLLMAVYKVMIYKYTRQNDILIGVPFAGRTDKDYFNVVGMFVNSLPIRSGIDSNKSFHSLVSQIRENVVEAGKNQDIYIEELSDRGSDNLLNVGFNVVRVESVSNNEICMKLGEKSSGIPLGTSKFDLSLHIMRRVEKSDDFECFFVYKKSLFEKKTIIRFREHYLNILKKVVDNPDILLKDINMLMDKEKYHLLYEVNSPCYDASESKTISDMFEAVTEQNLTNTAISYNGLSMSYKELNEKANRLGNYLRKEYLAIKGKELTPDTMICLSVERSLETIVGLLGIMKSGAAYVPIDAKFPKERVEFVLSDTNSPFLLSNIDEVLQDSYNDVVNIDLRNNFEHYSGSNINSGIKLDNLIYLIYTSGSTGAAKGVMLEHRNLVNYIYGVGKRIDFSGCENFGMMTGINTDLGNTILYMSLLSGKTLYIADEEVSTNPLLLSEFMQNNSIDVMKMVPSHLEALLADEKICSSILPKKCMILGGDSLRRTLVRKIQKYSECRVYNHYGPTETTVGITANLAEESELKKEKIISIGRPFINSVAYILDNDGNMLPKGVPGELFIGGEQVARGYYKRDDITGERFVSNIFRTESEINRRINHILYKTGDLVKYSNEGKVQFIGRTDFQVKIRGFRIELGEIESRLIGLDEIKDAVVLALDDPNDEKFLCGYYVSEDELDTDYIKEKLIEHVPEYMVPNIYVSLKEFPLTSNGKINRKALPYPDIDSLTSTEYIAPRNVKDHEFVKVWEDVLQKEKISIIDNFFNIGGSSLKAIAVVSRLQAGYKINMQDLFKYKTIEKLSDNIELKTEDSLTILPAKKQDFYAVSGSQNGMYLTDQMGDLGSTYNSPLIIEINTEMDREKLGLAIDELIHRHEILRTSFDVIEGRVIQIVHDIVDYKKEYAKISESEIDGSINEFIQPFDLKRAPLFRTKLLKISKEKHILLIDMHHIIVDGESKRYLIRDLFQFYKGEDPIPLKLQYKDYAEWSKEYIQSNDFKEKEKYWVDKMDAFPIMEFPLDHIRKKQWNYEGNTIHTELDPKTVSGIKLLEKKYNTTPYSIMATVCNLLLYKYTGQNDIVVGTVLSGRLRPEVQEMVGMFVNTLPLRTFIDSSSTYESLLMKTQEDIIEMLGYQDYPFAELVSKLGIKTEVGRNPIYDIVFNYLTKGNQKNIRQIYPEFKSSKFDLSFTIHELTDSVKIDIEYKTSLFKEITIERFLAHYVRILNAIVENPELKINDIEILTNIERNQILNEFNGSVADYPIDSTIVKIFDEVVKNYPDNNAVVYKGRKYTYAELDRLTDIIGMKLRNNGIEKDNLVPIIVNRSEYIIVGALSILKAGGGYIFVDPTLPRNRQDFIINDCEVKIVLTDAEFKGSYSTVGKVQVEYSFEELLEEASKVTGEINLDRVNCPEDIFGLITTSGSTGEPKGTMIEHRNYINFASYYNDLTDTQPGDQVASYASFSFDVSVATNFAPLLRGATVHILPSEIRLDILKIGAYFQEHSINVTFLPTPIGELYMKEIENSPLKSMAIGGEQLKTYKKRNYRVINAYSPSECTVAILMGDIDEKHLDRIPLGWVQPNNKVYIFDEGMNLCPIGVPGELYIGGVQVGRGYYNRPEINAKSFIIHEKYGRLYKSGDSCKWMDDGQVIYLGRIDFQVKVSGLRIELGEIENRTVDIKDIDDAVVLALDDPAGNKYLCGYYTSVKEIPTDSIRKELLESLPEYMVPTIFIHMDEFKLTPNGKVNRKILPVPDTAELNTAEYVPPRNQVESEIVEIWKEILGVNHIGINDDFFKLGGSSIKAVSLIAKLQKYLNISVADIFNYPTIVDMIENLESSENNLEDRLNSVKEKMRIALTSDKKEIEKLIESKKAVYFKEIQKYDLLDLNIKRPIQNILLTGATGYLGVHVLKELLENSKRSVYCIIRGENNDSALDRVSSKIEYYFGHKYLSQVKDKIKVFKGDLSEEKLGLSEDEYIQLSEKIDSIIHTAANVGHYGEYEVFYKSNVKPVINLVEFAKNIKNKDLHYVSTRSVCDSGSAYIPDTKVRIYTDNEPVDEKQVLGGVYVRTKREGEDVAIQARSEGINTSIYRVGNLVFNSETCKHQQNLEDNGFYQIVKAYVNIGYIPALLDEFEMSYVNYTAKAICKLFDVENLKNEIFHVYSPYKTKLASKFSSQSLGINIENVNFDEFVDIINNKYDKPVFKDFIENLLLHFGWLDEEQKKTKAILLQDKTINVLNKLGFTWKKIEASDFEKTIEIALNERREWISKLNIMQGIDDETVYDLTKIARLGGIQSEQYLIREGKENSKLYIIINGMLTESKKSYGGWEGTLRFITNGNILGTESILENKKSNSSIQSILEGTVYLEIDLDDYKNILLKNTTLFDNFIKQQFEEKNKLKRMIVALN